MKSYVALGCLALATVSSSGGAALIHDYEFTSDLSDSVAGGVALDPSDRGTATGSVSGGSYNFQQGAGLSLGSQLPGATYTIDIGATFDAVDGYRKLVSFNDLSSDNGLYIEGGTLNLYGAGVAGPSLATAGVPFTVRLTRDGSNGVITGFLNGTQEFTYTDSNNMFLASSALYFLRDDTDQNREDSSGSADYVRIFNDVNGVIPTAAVPEPASWAMMIVGFGMVGAGLRASRRRATFRTI